MMNLSYWEYKSWLSNVDYAIVGSGIVGLNCALHLKKSFPKARVLILEKGILPQGASTKNAGFACFGSISEILSDLKQHSEAEVLQLVKKRFDGISLLRKNLGDKAIEFQMHGGHELFSREDGDLYEQCRAELENVNQLLEPVFGPNAFFEQTNVFNFRNIQDNYITHAQEAQIDTGKMMQALLRKVQDAGVLILNGITVKGFNEMTEGVEIHTNQFDFRTKKLLIATNGFASQLLGEPVKPARAQVLITKPIPDLKIKGTFHLDEGFYYFRNIDNRILLGGGRNLDFKAEETNQFGQTPLIMNQLQRMLQEVILPEIPFEIAQRWSGIMGMGNKKRPIVKQYSNSVFCGVRLGGMGIAIGSIVGKELAQLAS